MKSDTKKLISVIMSTYNEEPTWLDDSIRSILLQSYDNLEFIIIIDNPKNNELIKQIEYYARQDARIKIVFNNENLGLVKSLNKGLEVARGFYILRIDADDIAELDRIEKQKEYLEKNKTDLVFSGMKIINEQGDSLYYTNLSEIESKLVSKLMTITNISNHPTWFAKAEVFYTLNGYRDIKHCEDYDFLLRAIKMGYKIGKMGGYTISYRIRDNSISRKNAFEQFLNANNLAKCYKKGGLEGDEVFYSSVECIIHPKYFKWNAAFLRADMHFQSGIEKIKNNQWRGYIEILNCFRSKYYLLKLYRIFLYKLYLNEKRLNFLSCALRTE